MNIDEQIANSVPLCIKRLSHSGPVSHTMYCIIENKEIVKLVITIKDFGYILLSENEMCIDVHPYEASEMLKWFPYCKTEEEFFQQSLIHNLNDITLETINVCYKTYFRALNYIEIC